MKNMDSQKKFNETSIPPREAFYSESNLEDITDKEYKHVEKLWDYNYHDLYVQYVLLMGQEGIRNYNYSYP